MKRIRSRCSSAGIVSARCSAAALQLALTMPEADQRDRMRFMRGVVREFNVYRWAGRMLLDAAVMRQRGRITTAMER